MKSVAFILVAISLGCTLASCEKESPHKFRNLGNDEAFVCAEVDWSNYDKEKVLGASAYFYDKNGYVAASRTSNFISKLDVTLSLGNYDVITINQSPDEFRGLQFRDMDVFSKATVFGVPTDKYSWAQSSQQTIEEPDWLAVASVTDAVVGMGEVDGSHETPRFCPDCCCYHYSPEFPYGICYLRPENVIYTLDVAVHIKNIVELAAVRSFIDGLAGGVSLNDACPISDTSQQILENWKISRYANGDGELTCSVRCFGLPQLVERTPEDNNVTLLMLLRDGTTLVRANLACGCLFEVDEANKIISLDLALDAPLPTTEHKTGGFEANVDDWGDEIGLDI